MRHYIAVIHKEEASSYGVHFPDVRGVYTAGDTLDQAFKQACEVLAFAAESWVEDTDTEFPSPRTIDELRKDPEFIEDAKDAILMAIPFEAQILTIAAE